MKARFTFIVGLVLFQISFLSLSSAEFLSLPRFDTAKLRWAPGLDRGGLFYLGASGGIIPTRFEDEYGEAVELEESGGELMIDGGHFAAMLSQAEHHMLAGGHRVRAFPLDVGVSFRLRWRSSDEMVAIVSYREFTLADAIAEYDQALSSSGSASSGENPIYEAVGDYIDRARSEANRVQRQGYLRATDLPEPLRDLLNELIRLEGEFGHRSEAGLTSDFLRVAAVELQDEPLEDGGKRLRLRNLIRALVFVTERIEAGNTDRDWQSDLRWVVLQLGIVMALQSEKAGEPRGDMALLFHVPVIVGASMTAFAALVVFLVSIVPEDKYPLLLLGGVASLAPLAIALLPYLNPDWRKERAQNQLWRRVVNESLGVSGLEERWREFLEYQVRSCEGVLSVGASG